MNLKLQMIRFFCLCLASGTIPNPVLGQLLANSKNDCPAVGHAPAVEGAGGYAVDT